MGSTRIFGRLTAFDTRAATTRTAKTPGNPIVKTPSLRLSNGPAVGIRPRIRSAALISPVYEGEESLTDEYRDQ
ncbi:hypothetical protein MicloDRAFT_00065510 [Microvirga lotononidis]|uniref:Uncharacterized protein n=1 Tax=Microvirga lotononidis TaxID=864069 RepID=I4YPD0_9HYPH|nr:hypothetical protein MicloDRAFT_00065510 [Microvirga lotononidis]